MLRLLIISDIHYPTRRKDDTILLKLEEISKNIDLLIGCGDYVSENVVNYIQSFSKKSFLVKGNMDNFSINLPYKLFINLENYKIGIIHGYGSPFKIENRILNEFEIKPDIIFFGHTHIKEDKIINNIRFINPGAFADGNYCIVEIDGTNFKLNFEKI